MTGSTARLGLAPAMKAQLLDRVGRQLIQDAGAGEAAAVRAEDRDKPALGHADALAEIALMRRASETLGLGNPFFRVTSGHATPWADIDGRRVLSFSAYNYLGLNGDPRVTAAAKDAADRYGTSVSGSRITSGERPVHRELEAALAEVYGADDAVALVGGHATNVTVIAHLVGPGDAVVYDALAHNSIIQGAQLSGARRRSFQHNDLDDLDRVLGELAAGSRRRLIVVEGCYGMDGDAPDLAALTELARRHRAHLMVDEAHALGVLGARGLGLAEHCGVDPAKVDVWMGTLSKTLASCGGYIAGRADLIDYLRCSVPGFLFSVGLPAPTAAAALAALTVLREEPGRVRRLHENGRVFCDAARELGLNIGATLGAAIIPVIIGSSLRTTLVANRLWEEGVAVQPILYPGVPERSARLRFFVTSEHDPRDLRRAAQQTARALAEIEFDPAKLEALIGQGR
jgi:8-amino-7-oxononanoate synthase